MQGHPWVYREALREAPTVADAQLCHLLDHKRAHLGWAIYDPSRALALRMLSTQKQPPTWEVWEGRFLRAWELRESVRQSGTDAYRLFNGEGDALPGLICDLYGDVAVLQFDGEGVAGFWHQPALLSWLREKIGVRAIVEKSRFLDAPRVLFSDRPLEPTTIREHGIAFVVDILKGQKTGFFFDQRENRQYIRSMSREKRVLNLFSYTGGFSVYAGCGGAKSVMSVDIAPAAIEAAAQNWRQNDLPEEKHLGRCEDAFAFLAAPPRERWDLVIVDPPSMAHAEEQKARAIEKYTETFALAARCVVPYGDLILSSCSSHIAFSDFFAILEASLSKANRTGQILRIAGQGIDHPFPHICHELRYLKFIHCRLS
jgi:23S rRNA (cytosine1962-C5)-methyltransferase